MSSWYFNSYTARNSGIWWYHVKKNTSKQSFTMRNYSFTQSIGWFYGCAFNISPWMPKNYDMSWIGSNKKISTRQIHLDHLHLFYNFCDHIDVWDIAKWIANNEILKLTNLLPNSQWNQKCKARFLLLILLDFVLPLDLVPNVSWIREVHSV